jgi:Cd2+/Zn2+-exporting ATPase
MKKDLVKLLVAAVLLLVALFLEHTCALTMWQRLLLYLIPYLVVGAEVIAEAFEGLTQKNPFDENFLMVVATVGALAIGFLPGGTPEFAEAVLVMLLFQVGELFEHYASRRSRRSIAALMDIRPDVATLVVAPGDYREVAAESVAVGQRVLVRPGARIPLDGRVVEGQSTLDTGALTGESRPRSVGVGDVVASGCVNLSAALEIIVTQVFGNSTASRIIGLVERSSARKSQSETFITRFARIYTPIVVAAAVLLAVVPPRWSGAFLATFPLWLSRALTFLVVSCPCALVLSVPLAFFGGIGGASRAGILVKGGHFMDILARLETVVFDKTGTLTQGTFEVEAVHPSQTTPQELLHLAAHVERLSTHPIAASLLRAYNGAFDCCRVEHIREVAGQGVCATVDGREVCVGNDKLMTAVGADWHPCHKSGTVVHVAIDGVYAGHVVISDRLKDGAADALSTLRAQGVGQLVMLTGDSRAVADEVAHTLGLDACFAELLPEGKVEQVERLLAQQTAGRTLAFVGDGINDAPVLARADVGIAMGALGADAAVEAADVVLMDDHPGKVALAVRQARRTVGIARANVAFAIAVKVVVLLLAAVGIATMWMAVFADVGVTVLAVLNAMRTLRVPR